MAEEDNWEIYKSMPAATSSLLNNQFLADIQFQLDDQVIYAHSHELSKRSKVFARDYQGTVGVMKLIVIPNQDFNVFYEFLKYIYSDACNMTNENVLKLLKLALKYEIISLTTTIRRFLMDNLACDNVLKLYDFCLAENFMPQISQISNFISENFYVLIKSNHFLSINLPTLIDLLIFDKVDSRTRETDISTAVMRWVNNYCIKYSLSQTMKSKRDILQEALKHIRFPAMTNEEFSRFIQTYPDFLRIKEINSIFISISLRERNTYGFITFPRTVYIDYAIGPNIILNMRPYFGMETKAPPLQTDCGFSVNQNIIITSIDIGVSLVPQTIKINLLNQTKQVMRHVKVEYDRTQWLSGSVQVVFDLPFLLRNSSKYFLRLKYLKPNALVNGITERKLAKVHNPTNKLEIKFDDISPFLLQMNFKEFVD